MAMDVMSDAGSIDTAVADVSPVRPLKTARRDPPSPRVVDRAASPRSPRSPSACGTPTMEEYFQLAREAQQLDEAVGTADTCKCIVYLPCGDVHVCRGARCSASVLSDDGHYVCPYSGHVVDVQRVRDDYSTGRMVGSANPDDTAGEPLGGKWKPRVDHVLRSEQAFVAAGDADDGEEVFEAVPKKRKTDRPKRGARCVDAPVGVAVAPARLATGVGGLAGGGIGSVTARAAPSARSPSATSPSAKPADADAARDEIADALVDGAASAEAQNQASLYNDALLVLNRLVNFERRKAGKAIAAPTAAQRLTLLTSKTTLFELALRKYARECITSGTRPQLDVLHNMELNAAAISRDNRARAAAKDERSSSLLQELEVRQSVSRLIVSLWVACAKSSYMCVARRSSDSFKPFVSGCLYALKRGVALSDGSVILPNAPEVAAALPALRATAINSTSKALHASSHRGLSTLHRSIASCATPADEREIFGDCVVLARSLSARLGRCG